MSERPGPTSRYPGPTSRYTAIQMRFLYNTFIYHCVNSRTTNDHAKVAQWLKNGQAWVTLKGEIRKGGHAIWAKYWTKAEAAVLWEVIRLTMDHREEDLTATQHKAFKRRQRFIEAHWGVNALELMASSL